jgi:hypothetical protein
MFKQDPRDPKTQFKQSRCEPFRGKPGGMQGKEDILTGLSLRCA